MDIRNFVLYQDHHPNVWYSINGERLGTYDGHCGAVWCLDPKWDTTHLVTGAADNTVRLWDIETGKELNKIDTKSAVRTANFSFSGNLVSITWCSETKIIEVTIICPGLLHDRQADGLSL